MKQKLQSALALTLALLLVLTASPVAGEIRAAAYWMGKLRPLPQRSLR